MPVGDDVDLPTRLTGHAVEERGKHGRGEPVGEHGEPQRAPGGDRGHDIDAQAFTAHPHDRRAALRCPGASGRCGIRAQLALIYPRDHGTLGLRPRLDRRMVLIQPSSHRGGLLLAGAAGRALRGETVTAQPQPHALLGHAYADNQSNQLDHRLTGPQRAADQQLLRGVVGHGREQRAAILGVQVPVDAQGAPPGRPDPAVGRRATRCPPTVRRPRTSLPPACIPRPARTPAPRPPAAAAPSAPQATTDAHPQSQPRASNYRQPITFASICRSRRAGNAAACAPNGTPTFTRPFSPGLSSPTQENVRPERRSRPVRDRSRPPRADIRSPVGSPSRPSTWRIGRSASGQRAQGPRRCHEPRS